VPSESPPDIEIATRFQILSQDDNPVVFLRLRSDAGDSLMSINVGSSRNLGMYNDVAKEGIDSSQPVSLDDWHELSVVLFGPDDDRQIAVFLDGILMADLSGPIDLGSTHIGGVQLGDSTGGRIYDVRYSMFRVAPAPGEPPDIGTPVSLHLSPVNTTLMPEGDASRDPVTITPTDVSAHLHPGDPHRVASRDPLPP
jgi:hypothetical protein